MGIDISTYEQEPERTYRDRRLQEARRTGKRVCSICGFSQHGAIHHPPDNPYGHSYAATPPTDGGA